MKDTTTARTLTTQEWAAVADAADLAATINGRRRALQSKAAEMFPGAFTLCPPEAANFRLRRRAKAAGLTNGNVRYVAGIRVGVADKDRVEA